VKVMPWVPLLIVWLLAVCVLVILPATVWWWLAVIVLATAVAMTILVTYMERFRCGPG